MHNHSPVAVDLIIMQLGHPQPRFANQILTPVESGLTLVTSVTCDTSWMLTLFCACIGSVNQSPVGRSTLTGGLCDVTV